LTRKSIKARFLLYLDKKKHKGTFSFVSDKKKHKDMFSFVSDKKKQQDGQMLCICPSCCFFLSKKLVL